MTGALLTEIENFCRRHDIAPSTFGERAVRNSKLWKRLSAGGYVSPKTEEKIRIFIREHDLPARARQSVECQT